MAKVTQKARSESPEAIFGRALRKVRESRKISQDQLGYESGYHRTYIGQLERGEKSPSLRTIFNLCATLGVKASDLIRQVEATQRR